MPVTTVHPQYENKVKTWAKIENVLDGLGKLYIPDIEPCYPVNHILYDEKRNYLSKRSCELYRESGIFINFSRQTLDAIVALALNAPPTYQEIPDKIAYLETDATGNKLSLDQLKQKLISSVVAVGRIGLLTDYPAVPTGLDAATQLAQGLGPRMYVFDAKCGINWKTTVINGKEVLSLVVISKSREVPIPNDRFSHKCVPTYLILELVQEGETYTYYQSELGKDGSDIVKPFTPLKNGKTWDRIPFTFIGSQNNDANVDTCPLETLVELNIGHLRNSCVYEDNLKKYGRGTLVITSSLDSEQWQQYYENRPIVLGTDEGYFVGETGAFTIAQLAPAQEAAAAMNQKQEQMLMIGAHIVIKNPTNVSSETTVLNMAEKLSMLNTVVGNVEDALNEHIGYCAEYQGLPVDTDNGYINLSREFIKQAGDPLVMAQLLAAMNGGAIPARVYLAYLQSVGLLPPDEDLEKLQADAENENPFLNTPPPVIPGNNNTNNNLPQKDTTNVAPKS